MISYIVWNPDPGIFDGFYFLRWYGLCWAVGMFLGYQAILRIYKAEGISFIELDKLAAYLMVGAIVGARLGHILFYDPLHYANNPIEILPIRLEPSFQFTGFAGLASHGGVLETLLSLYIYARKFKKDYLWMLDRLVIAGSLLGCSIRIGNLINSEVIGTPSQVPWALIFSRIDQTPRHPAQLYEALFYLVISLFLFFIWKSSKVRNYKGFLFGLGISLIFSQRFLVEFLKENQVEFEEQLKLNMGQMLSIPLILIGILIMLQSIINFASNKDKGYV